MKRLQFHKAVAQPQLISELEAAGVPYTYDDDGLIRTLIVQITESVTAGDDGEIHPTGNPPLVEVVFADSVADQVVTDTVNNHVPADPTPEAPAPTPLQQLAAVVIGALDTVPDDATPAEMRDAVKGAIAEAAGLAP